MNCFAFRIASVVQVEVLILELKTLNCCILNFLLSPYKVLTSYLAEDMF